jgi:hypothetical protein
MDNDDKSHPDESRTKPADVPLTVGPFVIDPPMRVDILSTGHIQIDCPCLAIGTSNQAHVLRILLTPLAVKGLKNAFAELEKTHGDLTRGTVERSTQ